MILVKEAKATTCKNCNIIVNYKTKKPSLCKKCHEEKYGDRKFYHKPKSTPQRSRGEFCLNKILNDIFPDMSYIDGGYYSFLQSPKGYPMQLDRYYPRLHLAFEFDGKQHSSDVEYFYKNEEQFKYQQECDRLKEDLCNQNKIIVIRINYNDKITKELIVDKLIEKEILNFLQARTRVVL